MHSTSVCILFLTLITSSAGALELDSMLWRLRSQRVIIIIIIIITCTGTGNWRLGTGTGTGTWRLGTATCTGTWTTGTGTGTGTCTGTWTTGTGTGNGIYWYLFVEYLIEDCAVQIWLKTAQNDWRGVGWPRVVMHCNCHFFSFLT